MKQDDKELLLKDICARLPYKVKCLYFDPEVGTDWVDRIEYVYPFDLEVGVDQWIFEIDAIKPYLYPLSSMTDEQIAQLEFWVFMKEYHKITDFYYENHIDFRGLIEKSLALDATNLNIY